MARTAGRGMGSAPTGDAPVPSASASAEALPAPFWSEPLLRSGVTLTIATGVMNAANWLYHVMMSRALGPADYGALSALIGLLLVLTVPMNTIQMGVSAFVALAGANRDEVALKRTLIESLKTFMLFAVGAFAILALLSGWLAGVLKLRSPIPVVIIGVVLVPWAILPVFRGLLQGTQRFVALGASLATEAVVKLAVASLLVTLGLGLGGAVAGVGLGSIVALGLTLPVMRTLFRTRAADDAAEQETHGVRLATMLRSLVPYALAIGCFTVLTQADVVLVKALFAPHEAGVYAAASTGGRIVLSLTGALPMVMLPEIVRRTAANVDGRSVVIRGLLYVGLTGGALVILYAAAPIHVIRVIFGSQYLEATSLLWPLGLAMLMHQLALLGMCYQLGIRRVDFLRPMVVLAATLPTLLWISREDIRRVPAIMVGLGILTFVVAWRGLFRRTVSG